MAAVRIQEAASLRLDEIYRYTHDRWGAEQAERYVTGLFAAFEKIETRGVLSKPVPAELGVDGYVLRYERHFVYWRRLSTGDIGVVHIITDRTHQTASFRATCGTSGHPESRA